MKRLSAIIAIVLFVSVLFLAMPVFAYTGNGSTVVYITRTGGRYHDGDCGSLWNSRISIKLEDAIIDGYTRCTNCNPPIYTGTAKPGDARKVSSGSNSHSDKHNAYTPPSTFPPSEITSTPSVSRSENTSTSDSKGIFLYIVGALVVCFVMYRITSHFFKNSILYKRILVKQRKKQLYEDVSLLLLQYQKFIDFRSSPSYVTLCKKHKDKSSQLELLLSDHNCEFGEDGKLQNKKPMLGYGRDFTIYRGRSCYHSRSCQYAFGPFVHILDQRMWKLRPCSKCNPPIRMSWMQDCVNLHNEISELEDVIYFPLTAGHDTAKTPISLLRDLCKIQEKLHHQVIHKTK